MTSYTIPSPVNTSYAAPSNGRLDDVHTEVGAVVEKPNFVDNAVHHARYEVSQNNSKTMVLKSPNKNDFQVTSAGKYRITEEQDSVRLAHQSHEDAPFFDGIQLSESSKRPMLLIDANDPSLKLRTKKVSSADKGVRIELNNMKGRNLNDVQMKDTTHVYAGQILSVGLKSTDLVERLFDNSLHGLNSVKTEGSSTLFVAQNFNSLSIPSAIRYVARHDHYIMYYDRFGNFKYAPKVFSLKDRQIGFQRGVGKTKIDPIVEIANRIVIKGKGLAVNDNLSVEIDDAEMQKRHGSIKQMTIKDPTANSDSKARKAAGQALRLNKKAQGALKSEDHSMSWDMEPGDVVDFNHAISKGRQALIEVSHNEIGASSFQMVSYEAGLESILTAFGDDGDLEDEEFERDKTFQVQVLNKSGVGQSNLSITGIMNTRRVSSKIIRSRTTMTELDYIAPNIHAGMLLGHRNIASNGFGATRSALGVGWSRRVPGTLSGNQIIADITDFPTDTGVLILDNQSVVEYTGVATSPSPRFTNVTLISGAAIPASIGEIRLARTRSHEMRYVKSVTKRRMI